MNGKVFDVTPEVENHTGGEEAIVKFAGQEVPLHRMFGAQHPEKVRDLLHDYCVGSLIQSS